MQWRPEPEQASAWSAIGGVVVVVSGTSAVLLAVQPSSSHVPAWVVWGCVGLVFVGLYGMLAPLLKWWPWHGVSAAFGGRALPKNIKNEQVDLTQLAPGRSIIGRTFKECEIVGPGEVHFGGDHLSGNEWADRMFRVVNDLPPDTIRFYRCRFLKCQFSGFTAVGPKSNIEQLKTIFRPESPQ